ncbi:terminase (plasmid) [Klebsiella pneumoniae]|nr:terminase [Klebsiella pneumoniae]
MDFATPSAWYLAISLLASWCVLRASGFFHDLEHGPARGVYFDEGRAQHVLDFYNFVPHVKGHLTGKPIELMDWHVFILINLLGLSSR